MTRMAKGEDASRRGPVAPRRRTDAPSNPWKLLAALLPILGTFPAASATGQLPAFPGAEGFGALASGGRSGDVYHVTTLSGSAATPGSFAYGLKNAPASGRTIVFDVSGNIPVPGNLGISQPNLTIAGQTAPGDGVALTGGAFWIEKTNVVVRHMRFRNGVNADCLDMSSSAVNVILDHCDTLFGTDENFSSFSSPPDLMTFQWSANAWGLHPHACGGLWDVQRATAHHTLWAHHQTRDPKARPNGLLDWINNVTYDYAIGFIMGDSTTPADWKANVEGCYFVCPPGNLMRHILSRASLDRYGNPNFSVWMTNCLFDSDGDLVLDGRAATWSDVLGSHRVMSSAIPRTGGLPVTQDPPLAAYKKIVSAAGPLRLDARHPGGLRDEVSTELIRSLLSWRKDAFTNIAQCGASAGGYGTLRSTPAPHDGDRDGMPDFWEATTGSNPAADDHKAIVPAGAFVPAGYTRLEEYLQFRAMPHATIDRAETNAPSVLDVDLRRYTAGFTNRPPAVYTISNVSTGAVTITGGTTARFEPPAGFAGRARFDFGVTDSDGSSWTQTFAALVSAAPLPRNLVWKGDGAANTWDTNALSFVEGGAGDAVAFRADDAVTFNDDGDDVPAVVLTGALRPGSLTVETTAKDYTFGGSGTLAGAAGLTKRGAGRLTLLSTLTNTGPVSIEGGAVVMGSPGGTTGRIGPGELTLRGGAVLSNAWTTAKNTLASPVAVPAGETGTVATAGSLALAGALTGGGDLVVVSRNSTGDVQLAGVSAAYAGAIRFIRAGTNPVIQTWFAGGSFNGLPLASVDLGETAVLRPVTMASSNLFAIGSLAGGASAVLGGGSGGPVSYSLGGLNRDDVFEGSIEPRAKLIKTGSGTLTLTGIGQHTGLTTIASGTLSLSGTFTVSRVAFATGAVLRGTGRIGGGVAAGTNAVLSPGAFAGGAGTLIVSNGVSLRAARLEFDLSASPAGANDRIVMQGGTLGLTGTQSVAFRFTDGRLGAGTYALIDGGAATVASGAAFAHDLPTGTRQLFALATPPGRVLLEVTNDSAALVWRGTAGSAWDHAATNWVNGAAPDRFWRLDTVVFDDTSTNGAVTLAETVEPGAVVVSNTARAYTLSGPGCLTGATSLVKAGPGTLTLNPLSTARLSVTASNSVSVTVSNTAGLVAGMAVAGAGIPAGCRIDAVTATNAVALTAPATAGGTNSLTFAAVHTYGGGTEVRGGVLALGGTAANANALGGAVTLDGGTLQVYGYGLSSTPDYGTFSNDLVVATAGTLRVPPRGTIAGRLDGAGTLDVVDDYVRANFSGDWSAFGGVIRVRPRASTAEFRIAGTAGFGAAALELAAGITMYTTLPETTIAIGELSGAVGSVLGPGNGSATNPTWVVGGRNTSAAFAGAIRDAGVTRVVKSGTGAWTLSGSNTFSGGMEVAGGALFVNNAAGSGTGSGAVDVREGATLGGTGTVAGATAIEADATLAPGDGGLGTLTFGAALSLAAGSTTVIEIDRARGTSDVVVCLGPAALDGDLVVTNLAGEPAVGDSFRILDHAGVTGTFSSIVGPPARQAKWEFEPATGILRLAAAFPPGSARYESVIALTNYARAEPLTNFPVLVSLGPHVPGFDYNSFLAADGRDLRFREAGATNDLSHEIDTWNPAGESWVWVRVPVFSNGCELVASWGWTGATNVPASSTNGSVWSGGYVGVWHLHDAKASDSTARGHGATSNSSAVGAGLVGNGAVFEGLTQQVRIAAHGDFNVRTNFEIQGWFKVLPAHKPSAGNYLVLTSKEAPSDFNNRTWWLCLRSDGKLWWKSSDLLDIVSPADLADGAWHHVSAVHEGAVARLYVDGLPVAEDATPGVVDIPTAPVLFGGEDGTLRYFKGALDEMRVSNVSRSSNWVWAVHRNLADPAAFAAAGGAVVVAMPPPPSRYRASIAFPGYAGAGALSNFPALVLLGTNLPGFRYDQFRGANGADLRFETADGLSELNYEIDTWDTAGVSRVWVQVPCLTAGCSIAATWGNTALAAPASATNGATWSGGYLGVWHLRETSGPHRDSSPAAATSRFALVTTQGTAVGIIGACDGFSAAAGDHVSLPDMGTNAAVTVECWVNLSATPSGSYAGLVSSDSWTPGVAHFKTGTGLPVRAEVNGGGAVNSTNGVLAVGTWAHAAYTVAGAGAGGLRSYCNGRLLGTATGTAASVLTDVNLAREFGARYLDARIDEVRISSVARPADWLAATWMDIASNAAFCAYGAVTDAESNSPPVLAPIPNGSIAAGLWVRFTNTASDVDAPPQKLVFSLPAGPSAATMGAADGVFSWRVPVALAGKTSTVLVAVTDDGGPPLGATQAFAVAVAPLATPAVSGRATTDGRLDFEVTGDPGPDYAVEISTNLIHWSPLFTTNPLATPFQWSTPSAPAERTRFYRIRLEP